MEMKAEQKKIPLLDHADLAGLSLVCVLNLSLRHRTARCTANSGEPFFLFGVVIICHYFQSEP